MLDKEFLAGVDNVVSTLLKNHNTLEANEAQTRWLLIDPFILDCLGYNRDDIIVEYSVDSEDRVSVYNKLDYCIIKDKKSKLLIEAKGLGIDLYSKIPQLSYYFSNIHAKGIYNMRELVGILTDGDLYLFFTDSIELGTLDTEPYFTIRLSTSEEHDRMGLLNYGKENLSVIETPEIYEVLEYDLEENYRIDMLEDVYAYYNGMGIDLCISRVYIRGKLREIKSFRGIYREILKEVNVLEPNLLYELAQKEEEMTVKGSITNSKLTLTENSGEFVEINTKQGLVYASLTQNRKGIVDRIIELLKSSNIGLLNVTVRVKEK